MNRIINNPLIIVITGIVIGWFAYLGLICYLESRLEREIVNANWLSQTIERDPSLNGALHDQALYNKLFDKNKRDTLVWRLLTTTTIIEPDVGIKDAGLISREFFNQLPLNNQEGLKTLNSIDLLVKLLQFVANGPNEPDVNIKIKEKTSQALASGDFENYDNYLQSSSSSLGITYDPNENEVGNEFHALLNRLFIQFDVNQLFLNLPTDKWTFNNYPEERNGIEELRQLRELSLQILTSIFDDPSVSNAKMWLDNFKGPEQNIMFCMFFVGLFILIIKKIASSSTLELDDDLSKRLKLYYVWLFSSLTAVGFIGTIRGLSQALSSADVIFKSSPGLEQAISISQIAEVLGIAFATTLIALLLTLVLGLIRLLLDPTDQFKIDEV